MNDNKNGFLQARNMATYLDITTGTLASWRKQGKLRSSSFVEPSEGLFLYEIVAVLKDLRASETVRNFRYAQAAMEEAARCAGCSCNW